MFSHYFNPPSWSLSQATKQTQFFVLSCAYRYASLYFCCAVEQNDNELLTLEIIHRYVELLDKYFGSVSIWPKWTNEIVKIVRCDYEIIFSRILCSSNRIGMWTGYHIQFRKGILHTRRIANWRWNSRNVQEKCLKSNRSTRRFARGQYTRR